MGEKCPSEDGQNSFTAKKIVLHFGLNFYQKSYLRHCNTFQIQEDAEPYVHAEHQHVIVLNKHQ